MKYTVLLLLALATGLGANPIMVHYVAYSPSYPWEPGQVADSALVWNDLENLNGFGFQGIVTYGTRDSLFRVARYARYLGFWYVVMGVWIDSNMVANQEGIDLAIEHHEHADAICVGNEALFFNLVDTSYLASAMDTIRAATGKPVTTSEHWTMYHQPGYQDWLLRNSDFLFPVINAPDNGITSPDTGARWVAARFDSIELLAGESLGVLLKESGWPTRSDSVGDVWASEQNQYTFFHALRGEQGDTIDWFCFEAYDGHWKDWGPTQRYWGLFDTARNPKLFAYSLSVEEGSARPAVPPGSDPARTAITRHAPDLGPGAELFDPMGRRVENTGALKPGVYLARQEALHKGTRTTKVIVAH